MASAVNPDSYRDTAKNAEIAKNYAKYSQENPYSFVMKHVSIKISGRVQGVFFRASTKEMANKLGIKGFVRNERDGSVYVEAEADEETLKQFVQWCHQGPSHAEVQHVRMEEGSVQGFTSFEIRRF